MRIRLRFVALLLLSVAAIAIGVWPSVFTLGALLAIPLALVAVVGLIKPSRVLESRALRRFSAAAAGLLAAEFGLLLALVAWTPRRRVELVTRVPSPPRARIVYGVVDGTPRRWLHWARRFEVPASGVVYTRYAPDNGWYRSGEMHPLQVTITDGAGAHREVHGAWIGGGIAPAGRCVVAYDDFSLVSAHAARAPNALGADAPRVGPLDSINTWGLACRDGKLVQATGSSTSLHRSGPACYYDVRGSMACGIDVRAP